MGARNEFRLLWFVTNSTWDGDDRSVMMGISCLECLLAVIFIVLVGWLSTEQKQTIENIGVSNISLQDYAVKVDYIPRDADPKEIGTHFARFGKVNQVVIGTDIDGVLGLHRKRAAAERAAETAEVRLAKAEYYAQKKENPSEAVQKGLAKLRERVLKLDGKVSKIMATIDEEMSSGEHGRSTSAFVTYETETAKEKCVKLYKPGNLYGVVLPTQEASVSGPPHVGPRGAGGVRRHLGEPGHHRAQRGGPQSVGLARHDHRALRHRGSRRVHEIAPKLPPARHLLRDAQARRHPRVRQDLDHHRRDRSGVQGCPRQPAAVFRAG